MKPARRKFSGCEERRIRRIGERGAVLVEMAFVLPILTIIFVGILDLGLVVREYQLLQNAVREGARYSSLPFNQIAVSPDPNCNPLNASCTTLQSIKDFVVKYCARENITVNSANVTVNQNYTIPIGASSACGSEVTVIYTRPLLLLGSPFFPFGSVQLQGRAVFHNLYGC